MVKSDTIIRKIIKELDRYFIKLEDFSLKGASYDIILSIPEPSAYLEKYRWVISAEVLNNKHEREVISDLLVQFKKVLNESEYASIAQINVLNSNNPLVRNLNFMFPYKRDVELTNIAVGGVQIEHGFILRSNFLDNVIEGHAITILHKDQGLMNVGVIEMKQDFTLKCWTAKALRELFNPNMGVIDQVDADQIKLRTEEFHIENELVVLISFEDIIRVENSQWF
jgi:hypothetical protein